MPTALRWTQRRRAVLEQWILDVKPLLKLSDWTITVDWDGDEHTQPANGDPPSAYATMSASLHSKHAVMAVGRQLLELAPQVATQAFVHELMHCHLFPLQDLSRDAFATAADGNELALQLHATALQQQVEIATDALADAFTAFVPEVRLV